MLYVLVGFVFSSIGLIIGGMLGGGSREDDIMEMCRECRRSRQPAQREKGE